jgi:hypothetical protein
MKIYIHHYYQNFIYHKFLHNTKNRTSTIKDGIGSIFCNYRGIDIEFIFKQEISFEEDGYHILDYFTAFFHGVDDPKIGYIHPDREYMERETQQILKKFIELLKGCPNNQKWIIGYFRTEKILQTKDINYFDANWLEIESLINQLKNHHIVTDNIFLNDLVGEQYPNFYYALTNTIFQWNDNWNIRWYYEFKQIYDKLTFDYDLMYSIRNHKANRVAIINELNKLNNNRLYLQNTDGLQNPDYFKRAPTISHINTNSVYGETDFDDITYIGNHQGYMDAFFRFLPKAKMQILCESWSWSSSEFTSQYVSEKTFGFLLAGIPFISTHNYPLQMVERMLKIEPHPFYNESKKCKANPKLFAEFVNSFLNNFTENHKLCKDWSDLAHTKLLYKIQNENSLLDLIIDGKLKKEFTIKKSLL